MATTKSFADLGKIYEQKVLNESQAQNDQKVITESDASKSKQTVGKVQEIGTVKLVKEGGDEKVKKDLDKPKEAKTPDGKPTDGDKALSQKKTVTESKTTMKESLFNKVYSQIVSEEADDLDGAQPTGGADELGETPAVEAGEHAAGGEEEAFDPVVAVKELCKLVDSLKKHFGVTDEEEVVAEVPAADGVPPVGEAVDMKEVPDSAGKSLQGKNNKVNGTKVNGAGKADGSITSGGDGKLEKGPDGEKLAGNKDNKVKGKSAAVTGGDKSALES